MASGVSALFPKFFRLILRRTNLWNRFPEIEETVSDGKPVFLTKNGYGMMVAMSLEKYAELTNELELKLDEADRAAGTSDLRHAHNKLFSRLKAGLPDSKLKLFRQGLVQLLFYPGAFFH